MRLKSPNLLRLLSGNYISSACPSQQSHLCSYVNIAFFVFRLSDFISCWCIYDRVHIKFIWKKNVVTWWPLEIHFFFTFSVIPYQLCQIELQVKKNICEASFYNGISEDWNLLEHYQQVFLLQVDDLVSATKPGKIFTKMAILETN